MDSSEFLGLNDNMDDFSGLSRYEELLDDSPDGDDDGGGLPDFMKPVVCNIIACADFGCELDLYRLAQTVRNAEYNPRRFTAVIVRISEPKAAALIFRNGKMNIAGCKTREQAQLAAKKFGRILKKLKYKVKLRNFEVKNMIATASCNHKIGLDKIASNPMYKTVTKYNPEVFSGLVYKIPQPKVTFLIFASGKIILTGAKTLKDLDDAAEWIKPILDLHEKVDTNFTDYQMPTKVEENTVKTEEQKPEEPKKPKRVRPKIDPFRKKPRS